MSGSCGGLGGDEPLDVLGGFPVGVGGCVRPSRAAVVIRAEPPEVRLGLDPRPNLVRVGDPGVVDLERLEVDAVLQAELDVRVVKFVWPVRAVLDADPITDEQRGAVLAAIYDRLAGDGSIMPSGSCAELDLPAGTTYGEAVGAGAGRCQCLTTFNPTAAPPRAALMGGRRERLALLPPRTSLADCIRALPAGCRRGSGWESWVA